MDTESDLKAIEMMFYNKNWHDLLAFSPLFHFSFPLTPFPSHRIAFRDSPQGSVHPQKMNFSRRGSQKASTEKKVLSYQQNHLLKLG